MKKCLTHFCFHSISTAVFSGSYVLPILLATTLGVGHADTGVNDQSKLSPFTVKAQVLSGCLLGAGGSDVSSFGSVNFGNISSLRTQLNQASSATAGSVIVQCSIGTVFSVALSAGTNGGANIVAGRILKNTQTAETLSYQIFQDPSFSLIWGNGSNGGTSQQLTADGTVQELKVYAALFAATRKPSAGQYTDTITVTVTY